MLMAPINSQTMKLMVKCNQAPAKDGQCPLRSIVRIVMSVFFVYTPETTS
jgi:hypothetical protein